MHWVHDERNRQTRRQAKSIGLTSVIAECVRSDAAEALWDIHDYVVTG